MSMNKRSGVWSAMALGLAAIVLTGGVALAQSGQADGMTGAWSHGWASNLSMHDAGHGGPGGGMPGHPGGGGHHPGDPGSGGHHPGHPGGGMMPGHPGGGMMPGHPGMHEDMPDECGLMHDDPEMMAHMMEMMRGSMDPAECEAWMTEHDIPSDHQAECLDWMTKFQGKNGPERPAPLPDPTFD